jgi:hypothetical protein
MAEKRRKSFPAADITFEIVPEFGTVTTIAALSELSNYGRDRKFGLRFASISHRFAAFRFSSVAVTEKSAETSIG